MSDGYETINFLQFSETCGVNIEQISKCEYKWNQSRHDGICTTNRPIRKGDRYELYIEGTGCVLLSLTARQPTPQSIKNGDVMEISAGHRFEVRLKNETEKVFIECPDKKTIKMYQIESRLSPNIIHITEKTGYYICVDLLYGDINIVLKPLDLPKLKSKKKEEDLLWHPVCGYNVSIEQNRNVFKLKYVNPLGLCGLDDCLVKRKPFQISICEVLGRWNYLVLAVSNKMPGELRLNSVEKFYAEELPLPASVHPWLKLKSPNEGNIRLIWNGGNKMTYIGNDGKENTVTISGVNTEHPVYLYIEPFRQRIMIDSRLQKPMPEDPYRRVNIGNDYLTAIPDDAPPDVPTQLSAYPSDSVQTIDCFGAGVSETSKNSKDPVENDERRPGVVDNRQHRIQHSSSCSSDQSFQSSSSSEFNVSFSNKDDQVRPKIPQASSSRKNEIEVSPPPPPSLQTIHQKEAKQLWSDEELPNKCRSVEQSSWIDSTDATSSIPASVPLASLNPPNSSFSNQISHTSNSISLSASPTFQASSPNHLSSPNSLVSSRISPETHPNHSLISSGTSPSSQSKSQNSSVLPAASPTSQAMNSNSSVSSLMSSGTSSTSQSKSQNSSVLPASVIPFTTATKLTEAQKVVFPKMKHPPPTHQKPTTAKNVHTGSQAPAKNDRKTHNPQTSLKEPPKLDNKTWTSASLDGKHRQVAAEIWNNSDDVNVLQAVKGNIKEKLKLLSASKLDSSATDRSSTTTKQERSEADWLECLQKNYTFLLETLEPEPLADKLYEKVKISRIFHEELMATTTREKKCRLVIDKLSRLPHIEADVLSSLCETHQQHIAKILRPPTS